MKYIYGLFKDNRWGIVRSLRLAKAIRAGSLKGATIRRMPIQAYNCHHNSWDAPTFIVMSDPVE